MKGPNGLDRFIGHSAEVAQLRRQMAGAKAHAETFPHTLLLGTSGIGKTFLTECLAAEFGSKLVKAFGGDSFGDLVEKFGHVRAGDFFFVDEAHGLSPKIQEILLGAMDHGTVPADADGKMNLELPPFTLVLATDQAGRLRNAIHTRTIPVAIPFYPLTEMVAIVQVLATDLKILLGPVASKLLARVSGGLPRNAKKHLENLRRHCPEAGHKQIDVVHVREYLESFEIDSRGLGPTERRYMASLDRMEGASLDSVSLVLGFDRDQVQRHIEPQLLQAGFIKIGSRGRTLTNAGREWLRKHHHIGN